MRSAPILLVALAGSTASADAPPRTEAPRIAAVSPPSGGDVQAAPTPAPDAPSTPRGLALGVELGEPVSVTAGWFDGAFAVLGAIGSGTFAGPGLSAHVDAQLLVARLRPDLPLRVGLGARYYRHGYQPASTDELPDEHLGIRASAALALERGRMQLYAEIAPGIDVVRTTSCSLASGAFSVCPHAQDNPFFLQLVLGARWFLSR